MEILYKNRLIVSTIDYCKTMGLTEQHKIHQCSCMVVAATAGERSALDLSLKRLNNFPGDWDWHPAVIKVGIWKLWMVERDSMERRGERL